MTNEEALCCLANNPYDSEGLQSLYTHNRPVIDAAIQKWFGRSPVVPDATRYVLERIAARTATFAARPQTTQSIVAELAEEEARDLFEEIEKRIRGWAH